MATAIPAPSSRSSSCSSSRSLCGPDALSEPGALQFMEAESSPARACYVVIFSPQRRRQRFPEGCVSIQASEDAARAAARPVQGYHAAVASGPSRSSEGFRLYYLIRWLD